METTFSGIALERGLRLRVVPSSAWVRSDSILLERILLNLLSNATRFTTHGGIVVGCRRCANQLRIDVCDSGTGIRRISSRGFWRVCSVGCSTARAPRDGLGLGLSIVDRLSRLLHHPIEVNSWSAGDRVFLSPFHLPLPGPVQSRLRCRLPRLLTRFAENSLL